MLVPNQGGGVATPVRLRAVRRDRTTRRSAPQAVDRGGRGACRLPLHGRVRLSASLQRLGVYYRAEHIFALRHALELYDVHQTKIAECDAEIEQVMSVLNEARTTPREPLPAVRREEGRGNGFRADSLPEVRRAARQ